MVSQCPGLSDVAASRDEGKAPLDAFRSRHERRIDGHTERRARARDHDHGARTDRRYMS